MNRILPIAFILAVNAAAQQGWWMREPIRFVQTNLRETDDGLDAKRLIAQLTDMRANVLLESMGGIYTFNSFGDILREAHANHIRVVGRFDFSKTQKAIFDAHPEWFFRQANGDPVIYNGLYSTCINGGYYRAEVMRILAAALDKFPVDGLFFNMFGNQARDYGGRPVGLCHCDACRKLYRQKFNKEIPDTPDDDYRRFMFASSREVAAAIGDLIHTKRPQAGYFNYIQETTDGIMSESNTAIARALPLWPYSASDRVNRARNSQPGRMAINLNMQFVDFWWRFATVPRNEIALRSWENIANGGALTFEVNGTLDQQDRQALNTIKPIFRWAAGHEQYYAGQTSAARVLLLGAPADTGRSYSEESYRGLFRLLSEEHIPFAVSDNVDWLGKRDYDLVIASDWAPPQLSQYVANGGKLLLASAAKPEFDIAPVVHTDADLKGYIRVRDHHAFPSLKDTDLLLLNGPFTTLQSHVPSPLTLIPPSMIGPPELVHIDMKDTDTPAIVTTQIGKGAVVWLPWNLGALYYRESLPAHAALFRDVVDSLMPHRQVRTDAHPLVEMTLMHQSDRTLLHLVNLTGHSQTGYFDPIPMSGIHVKIAGQFKTASTVRTPHELHLNAANGYTEFTVPTLADYELVVLR